MLLKHTVIYFLVRGIPGLINLLAIAVYTRLLSPLNYGRYALTIAGIGFFNVLFFQWLRLSLIRFLSAHFKNPKLLLSSILVGYFAILLLTGLVGILLALLWPDPVWRGFIFLSIPLLWIQAWYELNLELARGKLLPVKYGIIAGIKTVIAFILGVLMVFFGFETYGPLLGLFAGMLLVGFYSARSEWAGIKLTINKPLLYELLRYGLPLTASFAFGFVINVSDRFIIAVMLGEATAGVYSASYDLAYQSLYLIMTILNLSSFPIILNALEQKGESAAKDLSQKSTTLLLAVALPISITCIILSPVIINLAFGNSYRTEASIIFPIIAVASLLSGIKTYHFDRSFHLSKWTVGQMWVLFISAIVNAALNLILIPYIGISGAAYATLFAYILAIILSGYLGAKSFYLPFPWKNFFRISVSTMIMALSLILPSDWLNLWNALFNCSIAIAIYLFMLFVLNVGGIRSYLLLIINK